MTRWEYHFIQVTNAPFLHSGTVPDFVNELAATAGSWSALTCTIRRGSNGHCRMLLRRKR
jgi:hypothetical protein